MSYASADNYKKAIERNFFIVNRDAKLVPFILNEPQQRILKELGSMDIILKARQEGISSLIIAMFIVDFITIENITCVIISHEDKATKRLFSKAKGYLDVLEKNFPGELPFKLKTNSVTEITNLKKNSKFYVGTAGARAFGHGETINNLHVSELSRWPNQERMLTGLMDAVPKSGRIFIETTANGSGDYFESLWDLNRDRGDAFVCHFLPWFELKEYSMPVLEGGLTMQTLIEQEKDLVNAYHLSLEQLTWRRWKITQKGGNPLDPNTWDSFNEQFPSNAEEAFIVSGNPVWSPTMLKYYANYCSDPKLIGNLRGYQPISVEPNEKGFLKVYKEPEEFHTYAIGVDVAEGRLVSETEEGKDRDASCAQVFDKTTYEQVAVWHGNTDPDNLGRELNLLGKYYNNALIGVERNAVGITPLVILRDLNYPNLYYQENVGMIVDKQTGNLGWLTTSQTKESLIADATTLLRDKYIKLADAPTVKEMKSFVRDSAGHASAQRSSHDDRCFIAGTKVLTNKGQILIEKIRVGDMVMTRQGYKPVLAIGNRIETVIKDSLLNLVGTPDHPIITKYGIVRLDKIKASDIIYIWNEKLLTIEEKTITDTQILNEDNSEFTSGDMTNGKNHPLHYIDKSGLTILEKFQKVILSIIKMGTRLITHSRILLLFHRKIILGFTSLQRDTSSWLRWDVHKAKELLDSYENGSRIIQNSQNVYINKMGEIKKVGQKERVYNLKVADCPEYFANNILVHNCMAMLIGIRMLAKAKSVSTQNEIERTDDDMLESKGFMMDGQSFNSKGWPINPNEMDELGGEDLNF